MAAKPALLFVSPIRPARGGNGLAMRMGVFLEAYARGFEVTLAVIPLTGEAPGPSADSFVHQHAHRLIELPLDRVMHPLFELIARHRDPEARRGALRGYPRPRPLFYDPLTTRELLADRLGGQEFSLVHAGRLYVAPLMESYLARTRSILDLDEDDGRTLRRIAGLLRANGEAGAAADHESDAAKYETLMGDYAPRFTRCVVAAEDEAAAIARRYPGASLGVISNAMRPAGAAADRLSCEPIDLLMVGSLGYYPNADGALFLCRDILPRLARGGPRPRLAIVGSKPPASVRALGERPGVRVLADVPDVAPYYAAARIVVVPIRAGGGSRIKILEAFAQGRPVVATSIGAEGLAVVDRRHLLIADSAGEFAAAIERLLAEPTLAADLVQGARRLVDERYSFERVAREIEALADRAPGVIECSRA